MTTRLWLALAVATMCTSARLKKEVSIELASDLTDTACDFMTVEQARATNSQYVGDLSAEDFAELESNPLVFAYAYGEAFNKNQILAFWYEEETGMIFGFFAKSATHAGENCGGKAVLDKDKCEECKEKSPEEKCYACKAYSTRLTLQKSGDCRNVPTSVLSCGMCPSCVKTWTGGCDVTPSNGGARYKADEPVWVDGFVNGEILSQESSGQWKLGSNSKPIYVCSVSLGGTVDSALPPAQAPAESLAESTITKTTTTAITTTVTIEKEPVHDQSVDVQTEVTETVGKAPVHDNSVDVETEVIEIKGLFSESKRWEYKGMSLKCCTSSAGKPTHLQDMNEENLPSERWFGTKTGCGRMFGDTYHNGLEGRDGTETSCPVLAQKLMDLTGLDYEAIKSLIE